MVRGIKIVKCVAQPPPWHHKWGQICKKAPNFQKSYSLLPHMKGKKWLHGLMPMKPSTKIVKFMATGSVILALG